MEAQQTSERDARLSIAFVGKGGAGKSTIAGTLCRLLARRGQPVLAIDSDPMPGLAFSLGVPSSDAPLPDDLIEETGATDGPRFRLRTGLTAQAAIEEAATAAPDGVRLLHYGKLRGHVSALGRSQQAFRLIVDDLPADWHVVGDLPGGTRQPFFGWGSYARTILVVVEPSPKSLLSARRLTRLALAARPPDRLAAVANKVREPGDVDLVRAKTGLPVVGAVPADAAFAQADRLGVPPLDHAPDAAGVRAVDSLLDQLLEERLT